MKKWMFGIKDLEDAKFLEENGFKDFVIGYKPKLIKVLNNAGYNVHVVLGTFKIIEKFKSVEYLAEDPYGRKHIWFGSGCPNNPEIRKYILDRIREIIANYDVKSIILDGIRFASPGSGLEAFATCFCEHCRRKAEDMGFSYDRMKKAVKYLLHNLYDFRKIKNDLDSYAYTPLSLIDFTEKNLGLVDWIKFREMSIMEFIKEVKNLILSIRPNVRLGAYIFTPSLAVLVGQNYSEIWKYLDFIKPMVYRIGKGVACLNYELAIIAKDLLRWNSWLSEEEILRILYKFFGFSEYQNYPLSVKAMLEEGLPISCIEKEFIMAKKLVFGKTEIHPIVMLHDSSLGDVVQIAYKTGMDGIDFFTFRKELKDNVIKINEVVQ
ncbi:MAG: hypothetical protein J7K23_06335 [Thermoproteales archaeon]|nr:hypothetical protein [Thermoproteales archaeon]